MSKKQYRFVRCNLYPDTDQKRIINQTLAYKRFVYNRMLEDEQKEFNNSGKCIINPYSVYKPLLDNTKDADNVALNAVWWDVRKDLDKFFAKETGFPKRKRKADPIQHYRTINNNNSIRLDEKQIKLPKLKWVNLIPESTLPTDLSIGFVIIIRNNQNKYFINIAFEESEEEVA